MKYLKRFIEFVFLFMVGGGIYYWIEILWRGYSHISMYILGGVCFIEVGLLNEILPWSLGYVWQCLIGASIITVLEFITGLIVNVWLGLGIWDYSNMPLNFMGQICLPFFLVWVALAGAAIILDDYIRWRFFDEEEPRYKLF